MCSATVQPMQLAMANGGRLRLSWFRLRACLHSPYMLRPDTMHPHNEPARLAALFLIILGATFAMAQQAQPSAAARSGQATNTQTQRSQVPAATGVHREGTDNILVDAAGVPLEDQSGKTLPMPSPEEAAVAPTTPPPNVEGATVSVPAKPQPTEPTKHGDQYTFKVQAQEVVLHATVVDQHQRLVTNLNKN